MAKYCNIGYNQKALLYKHIVVAIKRTKTIMFCDITALPVIDISGLMRNLSPGVVSEL